MHACKDIRRSWSSPPSRTTWHLPRPTASLSVDQKKAGSVIRLKPSRTREGSSQEKTAAGHSTRRARSAERQSDSRRQLARPGGFRDSEVSGSRNVLSPRRRAASLLRALDFQQASRPDPLKLVCL
ncbi:hypothetical protein FKP32DRAFT_975741 [Trametes sanguinea]|nr:hypothetical protein FKP32DRAFT_975741 [Trametes sanguinea]